MATKRIPASPVEASKLRERIVAQNEANREAEVAQQRALDVFTMFCEGHSVSGAAFVSIEGDEVVVRVPDIEQPELVAEIRPEDAAA